MQPIVKTIASGAAYGVEEASSKDFSVRAQINLWPRRAERIRVWEAGLAFGSGSVVPTLVCTLASPKDLPNPPVPGLTPHIVVSLVSGVFWVFGWLKSPPGDSNVQSSLGIASLGPFSEGALLPTQHPLLSPQTYRSSLRGPPRCWVGESSVAQSTELKVI